MRARCLLHWLTAATTLVSVVAAGVLSSVPAGPAMAAAATPARASRATPAPLPPLPPLLRGTGLYRPGPGPGLELHPQVLGYTPQYTLWSDGADKRRWIALPPGRRIDARQPDAWQFPPGTRLWKEFSHGGRRVETRYLERLADGRWRFATYVWNHDGSDATLAPAAGVAALPVAGAPGGRYEVPSLDDCQACHAGAAVPVLGFGALQLSSDRDPLAPHATPAAGDVDLPALAARGLLVGLPPALLATPPRIPAASPLERAALGYLQANCAHCHNHTGQPVPVRLTLSHTVAAADESHQRVRQSLVDAGSRYRLPGLADARVVQAGRPEASVLALRMRSRHPQVQMPPIGTHLPDPEGLALIERWIASEPSSAPSLALR